LKPKDIEMSATFATRILDTLRLEELIMDDVFSSTNKAASNALILIKVINEKLIAKAPEKGISHSVAVTLTNKRIQEKTGMTFSEADRAKRLLAEYGVIEFWKTFTNEDGSHSKIWFINLGQYAKTVKIENHGTRSMQLKSFTVEAPQTTQALVEHMQTRETARYASGNFHTVEDLEEMVASLDLSGW
jgi:hypothetical protein